jgi:hypothetical protein
MEEFETVREALSPLDDKVRELNKQISVIHDRLRSIKVEWRENELSRGVAFRGGEIEKRDALGENLVDLRSERRALIEALKALRKRKADEASAPEIRTARERRHAIEREAEIARLRTVREAVTTSVGLEKSNRRPAAWWFPLVTPDGAWFDGLRSRVQLRLEPLL